MAARQTIFDSISMTSLLALIDFGFALNELAAMEIGELSFWAAELAAYCEASGD